MNDTTYYISFLKVSTLFGDLQKREYALTYLDSLEKLWIEKKS